MKHNPFDAITILRDVKVDSFLRMSNAIKKLEDSKRELRQLNKIKNFGKNAPNHHITHRSDGMYIRIDEVLGDSE